MSSSIGSGVGSFVVSGGGCGEAEGGDEGSEVGKGEGRTRQPGPMRQWWVTETPMETRERVEKMLWSPIAGDSTPEERAVGDRTRDGGVGGAGKGQRSAHDASRSVKWRPHWLCVGVSTYDIRPETSCCCRSSSALWSCEVRRLRRSEPCEAVMRSITTWVVHTC